MHISYTIATTLIEKHEALFFNDGHLEMEDPLLQFEENPDISTLEHIRLNKLSVQHLRAFLNQPDIVSVLEQ